MPDGNSEQGQSEVVGASGTPSRTRAFADVMAGHIRQGCHQLGACGKAGLPWRTHMRWMAADASDDPDLAHYQSSVLSALEDQRQASIKLGAEVVDAAHPAKASAAYNVWRHSHDERFKRFATHDEAPSKVELTGADGGPVAVHGTREDALEALRDAAQRDPVLAGELRKLLGGG